MRNVLALGVCSQIECSPLKIDIRDLVLLDLLNDVSRETNYHLYISSLLQQVEEAFYRS